MGRRARLVVLALVALTALAAVALWLLDRWRHVYLNDARIAATVVTVSSEVSGRVHAISVQQGDRVAKGDLMIELDRERARLEIEEMAAQLARVDASRSELRTQQRMIREQVAQRARAAESQIAGSRADERASTAELGRARNDYRRFKALFDKGMIAAQRLDESGTALSAAEQREKRAAAGVETAVANLSVVKADADQIAVLERRIASLHAERESLAARLAQLRVDLGKREIRAAFGGVIDQTFVDAGEFVSPGTRLLMYHDPEDIWVEANVKETDIAQVKQGATATIQVDAYPGRKFDGKVSRIGHAATSQFALLPTPNPSGNFTKITQRIPIRVSLKQDGGLLRPGMMVEVSIDVAD